MASLVSRSQNGLPFSIKCDKIDIVHLSIIMSTHKTLFLLCALGLAGTPFLSLKASENRWPAFRGPDRQGHSLATNVPIEWETKGKIGWKVPLSLSGWASPVVDQGHVIVSGSREEAGSITLHVASYRLADGTLEWETKVFEPDPQAIKARHSKNSHSSCTPILANEKIYAHFGHFGTCALDLNNGKVLWSRVVAYQPVHGNGGSPALVDDRLIFSADGASGPAIYALNAGNGEILWKTDRQTDAKKTFSFSTPLSVQVKDQTQVISPGSGMVGAYDPADGSLLWRVDYGEGYSVIPRPILHEGHVFIGTGYDRPKVMAIRLDGATGNLTQSHVAWETSRSAPNTPSLIVAENVLFYLSDGGILTCADPISGKVHWSERLGGNYSASPVSVGSSVYFISEEGKVSVVHANPEKLEILAQSELGERTLASPAMLDGTLLIRSADHIWKMIQP